MTDDRLRSAFAELRRVEAAQLPPLKRPSIRQRRWPSFRLAFAIVLLLVLVISIIPRRSPQPSITSWRAPTDFLLKTPGQELLSTVPDLKGTRQ